MNLNVSTFFHQYQRYFQNSTPTLQVIGGGKMAHALVEGFVSSGFFQKHNVFVCAKSQNTVAEWNKNGYVAFRSDEFYLRVKPTGIILISVKPQIFYAGVQLELQKWITSDVIVISVMAGVLLKTLNKMLPMSAIRMMPNVACAIGKGSILITGNRELGAKEEEKLQLAVLLGSQVGYCIEINESLFDAAAALSGSGPAFIFLMMEAMTAGGVLCGLSRDLSEKLVASTVKGTAQLFLKTGESFEQLRHGVCSPAGTTIAGIRELERANVRSAFMEAICSSKKRAAELSLD